MGIARVLFAAGTVVTALFGHASAQDADSLAKALSNPLASMISVPFAGNVDFGIGANKGTSYQLNIQPVIPISLNDDWNVISRTIVPLRFQDDIFATDVFGLGDVAQNFFFSPKTPGPSGVIWGIGPVFLLPTATDSRIGGGKWGIGPTGVALVQQGPWTTGVLANHIWSVAGDAARSNISATYLQPFASYALGGGATLSINLESTYDWVAGQWTVPLNIGYSKVFKAGEQLMSWNIGGRAYLARPAGGPDWGIRAGLTLLFPTQ